MLTLVIGASIVDLFVTPINEKQAETTAEKVSFQLGDKVPIDIKKLALGGNGANVSVGLARLGLTTKFYTYIGSDILSQEIAENIKKEGVDIQAEKGQGYSSLSVILGLATDRVIFSHHPQENHDFTYSGPDPEYIYLTSIGNPWENAVQKVLSFIENKNISLAFSPGSNQMARINDLFFETLHKSSSLFINREEAEVILEKFGSAHHSLPVIMRELAKLGPKVVSVTNGKDGSYAMGEDKTIYKLSPFSSENVHEKTGAGDAYATGFLAGLIQNKSIPECMRQGGFSSFHVMQEVGATTGLLTSAEMLQLLEKHTEYQPEQLS